MKEKIKRFMKNHWKPIVGAITLVVLTSGVLIIPNLNSKQDPMETADATGNNEIISDVEGTKETETELLETTEESLAHVAPAVETINSSPETPNEIKNTETKPKGEEIKVTVKEAEKPASQPATATPAVPTTEVKYVPISEGWKAEASAKGNIILEQKAYLDSLIPIWKSGAITDEELRGKIIAFLNEQMIEYLEVDITSKGYSLCDKVPVIDLRDGGNLYSYVGTYSTGKQNPDGTNLTEFYNWSVFVF